MLKAIANVNEAIAPKLTGLDVTHQAEIDRFLIELDAVENWLLTTAEHELS